MCIEQVSYPGCDDGNRTYDWLKRVMDLVMGSALLILFSPLLVVIAILVRRNSPGPVFFRQVRIGRGNRPFQIFKFRTMCAGADRRGPQITATDDTRITTIGSILRTLKLDELPQLINVVKGDMSLVGPRPQVPRFVNEFPPQQRDIVLAVRPGITGPTQLKFRREEELLQGRKDRERFYIERLLPLKCQMDVEYVRNRSAVYDLGVLWDTTKFIGRAALRRIRRRTGKPTYDHAIIEVLREEKAEKRSEKADVLI